MCLQLSHCSIYKLRYLQNMLYLLYQRIRHKETERIVFAISMMKMHQNVLSKQFSKKQLYLISYALRNFR